MSPITETIKKLKQSPLFNLSLSSKELFHSNFLYWIGSNYRPEFGKLFSKYLKVQPNDTCIEHIDREKESIDISFRYSNGQEILIENKVKSVPYIEQLEKYAEKQASNKNYILLSLSEPVFFHSREKLEINGAIWFYLSYSDLLNMLQNFLEKIQHNYHRLIISDYCEFISGLIKVNENCMIHEDDVFDFHSINKNPLYQELIDIRLHDFYLKKKYELLAYEVYKKLKILGKNLTGFSLPLNWNNENPIISLKSGMTRSLGLMDLKYLIAKNVVLGIQIQGEHYRMVVEDTNGKIAQKIISKLNTKLWFNFEQSFPNEKIYPKKVNEFNKFSNTFFYRSVKLGTNRTIKQIIDIILADVEVIESNYSDIMKIIMEEQVSSI